MSHASSNYGGPTVMLIGIGAKYREIDIRQKVNVIGVPKAQGLIGLHNFGG